MKTATDNSGLFEVFYGQLKAAPLIIDCPVNVECKIVRSVQLPTNYFFFGEVVGLHAERRFLTNGVPDPEKFKPLVLFMPDNRFWALGECLGQAWQEGRIFKGSAKKD
jgi:flavin reductase (DIM6/NTAB) family NADH-FMN oxidoreductase RutF